MAIESKIEQELQTATKIAQKKNEDPQKYLTRLALAVTKLKDPEWEALSSEGQEWVNGAAEVIKSNKTTSAVLGDKNYVELEDFPDFEEVHDEQVDDSSHPDDEEEAPAPKKPEPKKNEVHVAPRKQSACHMIKKIVVKKPKITVAELSEKLKADGLKVSDVTIATLRSDLRDTLRVMNELNLGKFEL